MQQTEQSSREPKIRLMIVEDHESVRAGLRRLLETAGDIDVVAEAADGAQAVELAIQAVPDFMLLDFELPVLSGDAVMQQVLKVHPQMKVLVVSSHNERAYIDSMLESGAKGYLLKEDAAALLVKAIRSIQAGSAGVWLSPKAAELAGLPVAFEQQLSWRELAIVEHLLQGHAAVEIAAAMELTEQQVAQFVQVMMAKLEVTSPEALLEMARRFLPPPS